MLTQGYHPGSMIKPVARRPGWVWLARQGWAVVMAGLCTAVWAHPPRPQAHCSGPRFSLEVLAPGVWQATGTAGDSDASNRGAISNLLIVQDGRRTWAVGGGPTPVYARALACRLKARSGREISDVIAPWPRPELTLGQGGWPKATRWAHADVAAQMRERCPRCEERLRLRLGVVAAGDLGPDPIRLPQRTFDGDHGQLGPFLWWRLWRAEGTTAVTVFRLRNRPLWVAPGLLWGDGPPDLRDAEPESLDRAWAALETVARRDGARARWLPEQGPILSANAPAEHRRYLSQMDDAVRTAQLSGALETDVPTVWPGMAPVMTQSVRHGLNWQRLWQLREGASFDAPLPASDSPRDP